MAIKINWEELQRRIISWQDVEKVMLNGVQIRPEQTPADNYLCFTSADANNELQLNGVNNPSPVQLEISRDKINWTDYTIWDTITFANQGDKVYWRNKSERQTWLSSWTPHYNFYTSKAFWVSWDVNYLLCKTSTTHVTSYCFSQLFENTKIITAPELPATLVLDGCYNMMFKWCTLLFAAPELPATSLADSCYMKMFDGCSILSLPPKLPATILAPSCYYLMFHSSWVDILTPLSATFLPDYCYYGMYSQCSKIKMSETNIWTYNTAYRIPTDWYGVEGTNSTQNMFAGTWWTFTWTPNVNQTYYTSNQII